MLVAIPPRILIAYIFASSISISLLVFINAQQPFVLSLLLGLSSRESALYSGTLVFADELLALPCVLVWGAIADRYGCRPIAIAGFAIAGVALVIFVHCHRVFPHMLLARLLFSVGASALTTMLSAILTSLTWKSHIASSLYSSSSSSSSTITSSAQRNKRRNGDDDEQTRLLHGSQRRIYSDDNAEQQEGEIEASTTNIGHDQSFITDRDTTRLAGIIGFSTGIGALIAVFGYLRLPPFLSGHHSHKRDKLITRSYSGCGANDDYNGIIALQNGLIDTFHLVAFISIVVAIFLVWGLADDNDANNNSSNDSHRRHRRVLSTEEESPQSQPPTAHLSIPARSSFATRSVYEQTEERVFRRSIDNRHQQQEQQHQYNDYDSSFSDDWRKATPNSILQSVWKSVKNLVKGFKILRTSAIAGIAYLGAFSARAQTVSSSLFIPVLINKFYMDSGLCDIENPDLPPDSIKKACHDAFVQTSILTGVLQLFALFTAPAVGYLATVHWIRFDGGRITRTRTKAKNFTSILIILLTASLIGAIGSLVLSIYGPVNPLRRAVTIPSAIAMGISQSSSIVLSLALCASARVRLGMSMSRYHSDEVSGAIAGAYSASGGLGIIFLSKVGSALVESHPGAPFVIISILNVALILSSAAYLFYSYTSGNKSTLR